ncbi:hypothetical protein BOX15_Mlig019980g2 [Macrostomum lignano]|uniref:C2 domain-containing protein n=2 Tax=Macrostomum lignano TaxID=282301 RepID=A0A267DIT0_9PLAT|nr:hypothetical protein BOX15_Mlig019980g2 [Macrostomum lignano]
MAKPDEEATGRKRNILLETFDSIRDDLRRGEHQFAVKVRIVRGRQIQGGNVSPKVCVLFMKQKRWTQRETSSTNQPFWGESFHFSCLTNVETLLRENVTFRVVNSRMFRRNLLIGEFQLSTVLVAGERDRSMFNRWLAIVDPKDPATMCKGFLQVCVALVFPNEPEAQWPDPLAHNSSVEDLESTVLTCSGYAFLKITFILSVYVMQDIPTHDIKGQKVTSVAMGLSFAGKSVVTEPIFLPDSVSEPLQVKKILRLTVSWPSMCTKLNFNLYSAREKSLTPLCCHSFCIQDIAVESATALRRNVNSMATKSAEQQTSLYERTYDGNRRRSDEIHHEAGAVSKKNHEKTDGSKQTSKDDGFMPKIGPCFVNMYGAPLDTFEDKIDIQYIREMNDGTIEGCAYRGRVFVRLQSEFCESAADDTGIRDLELGAKEQRDLQAYARSNTFLLFGTISAVPLVADAKSPVQFELSIGHNGVNSMSAATHSNCYPSISFSINPKEILKTQRLLSGHSYSTLTLDNEKPAFLIESSWEDIRYRMHFYNYVVNLHASWERSKSLIVMSYKLGLPRDRVLLSIRSLCCELQQCMSQTPVPSSTAMEAGMNDMDKQWKAMRCQQLKDIFDKLNTIHRMAIAAANSNRQIEMNRVASQLCEKLTDVSLLLENIKKEPQLSIPDVFIYMLVNNERKAYARLPVASIYYCQVDAVQYTLADSLDKSTPDLTRYRGSKANRMETIFFKHIPGLRGIDPEAYWPIPCMARIKLLFGLSTTMRNGVLPPVSYYGIIYECTKISSFFDSVCGGQQTPELLNFKTDASGVNSIDASSSLIKDKLCQTDEDNSANWRWTSEWSPWPDTSVLVNSLVETVYDYAYMVHMRENPVDRSKAAHWRFLGYYTEGMVRIPVTGNRPDVDFNIDPQRWIVVMEKDPLTGEEVGWIEVKDSEEYCKDMKFSPKEVTTTVRLESNFARKQLQRKRRRRDVVYTESINITFVRSSDKRWNLTRINRFDGFNKQIELNRNAIRSWTQLQNLSPLPVDLVSDSLWQFGQNRDSVSSKESGDENPKTRVFRWIDDWQEMMEPMVSSDKRLVEVVLERRKIALDVPINSDDKAVPENHGCTEYGQSLTESVFHMSPQKGDRLKRVRLRRSIDPGEVSLSLQSTIRDRTIKLAPYPTFMVQRRVGKKSRLCCLFNSIDQFPAPTTVTAIVDAQQICRWEMRCYFHEARDLIVADRKDRLYLYAILSVAGVSVASSIIENDFNTQLWRWNETIIFRNLVFHEDVEQVAATPPVVVIEFFRKLPIHNDMFLGRCIVDSENFVVQVDENQTEDRVPVLQWYKVHLLNIEDAGCVLAGFHFRHRDTFRPSAKIFENSFLTPPSKNMVELFKKDRVVLDNMRRFEIPDAILPVLAPHVLKITSWGLRQLRKYMLSSVTRPTIEFRIGHNVIQTKSLTLEKSPNFSQMSHSLLIFLPVEIAYLPELFIVARDARSFGRTPLTGMAKIPLHVCRFKDQVRLEELDPEEIDFFLNDLCGRIRTMSRAQNETYNHVHHPLRQDFSREFFFLLEPPPVLHPTAVLSDFQIKQLNTMLTQKSKSQGFKARLRSAIFSFVAPDNEQGTVETDGLEEFNVRAALGDETLSKTKPDWWCKYYLSKEDDSTKAVNYLEGDRLEFYRTSLEDAEVTIGDPESLRAAAKRLGELYQISSEIESNVAKSDEDMTASLGIVKYNGFEDVFEEINLQRCNQMTGDEEGRKFGCFLGKVRLYYVGALAGAAEVSEKLEDLYKTKQKMRELPYNPLYSSVPVEMADQECLVRVYIVRALELQAGSFSNLPNSYVEVFTADNKSENQLRSNRASSVEMDNNPVYGCMFELYCILPMQTRLRVRVMDKSGLLFDEEIGSTSINLERRMTTIYRASCGLPQNYRLSGINAWRDVQKPSQILSRLCRRFGLESPRAETLHEDTDDQAGAGDDDEARRDSGAKVLHRYKVFPPRTWQGENRHRKLRSVSGYRDNRSQMLAMQSNVEDEDNSGAEKPQVAEENEGSRASSRGSFRGSYRERSGSRAGGGSRLGDGDAISVSTDGDDEEEEVTAGASPLLDMTPNFLTTNIISAIRQVTPRAAPKTQLPAVFKLEEFDRMNEERGIHLGPNDHEPEICRERLALNILRRLPLVREHVETRPLYNALQPGLVQGRLEMWVDIFSLGGLSQRGASDDGKKLKAEEMISKLRDLLPPAVSIAPREPQPYELRVVMWSVHDVIAELTSQEKTTGDLYIRAWMEGLGDTQETDVHYNSLQGEGEFNWRFVFQLDYLPHERTICGKQKVSLFTRVLTKIPPMLHIQVWDNRRFRFDDFIGSVELDLAKLLQPARHKDECQLRQRWQMGSVNDMPGARSIVSNRSTVLNSAVAVPTPSVNLFEVQRVYGYWPLSACKSMEALESKSGAWMVGKALMELEILSREEAELKPAGLGRGEPNQHPYLPPPSRLTISNSFWSSALAAFRTIFWPKYKWYIIAALLAVAFLAILIVAIVQMPMSTLTNNAVNI